MILLIANADETRVSAIASHAPGVNREGQFHEGAAIYLRVSTTDEHSSNQEHELRQAAERARWEVVKVYRDHGISGAKGRPAFDALHRDAPMGKGQIAHAR